LYLAATVRRGKEGVDARDENWEVGLIGVGTFGVVDRDGAVMTIRGARKISVIVLVERCARVGGAGGGHDHLLAGRRRGRSVTDGGLSICPGAVGGMDHVTGTVLLNCCVWPGNKLRRRRNDDWRKKG